MSDVAQRLSSALADRYHVEREIGQGGMATVYLARDLRHARNVALKVLHPDLAAALGAERFLAEIRTTANLQHPHILPLHDSGDADGNLFYVMPFVEGETLRARLQREQLLPVDDAIRLAREVLAALDYAHRHGVVHRDIKPENILLHDGSALVADFGISLAVSAASGPRMTQTGLSLGTPSYMSPEQATGDRVIDGRADIYATGAMLYEMLIGEPPFTGPTSQAVVARLLTEEPRSLTVQRKLIPPNVDAAVRKALQKLPADRFASASEMSSAMGRAEFTIDGGAAPPPMTVAARTRGIAVVAAAGVVAVLVGAVVGAKLLARDAGPEPAVRFSFDAPFAAPSMISPVISPDGSRIVYAGTDSLGAWHLFMRSLNDETPARFAGTTMALSPAFSPDGRQVAFLQGAELRRLTLSGGAVTTIAPVTGTISGRLLWVSDDTILVFGATLRRIAMSGVVDSSFTLPKQTTFGSVTMLSRANMLIAAALNGQGTPQLVRYSFRDGTITPLGIAGSGPAVVDGRLLYVDPAGALCFVPIDVERGVTSGTPTVLANGVRTVAGRAMFAAARNGTLVFGQGEAAATDDLVIVDRTGKAAALPLPARPYRGPRFSPDGRRLVVTISRGDGTNNGDVWTYDFASERQNRLTFDGFAISASWMADGRAVTFTHREPQKPIAMYKVAADASGTAQSYFAFGRPVYEGTYTSDGKSIIYRADGGQETHRDVFLASVDSPLVSRPLLASPFDEYMIALSPDNKWLAYVSDASGRQEVYVRRIDGVSGVTPISRNGGTEPRWGSARELLFRTRDTLFSVPMEFAEAARPGQPRALFAINYSPQPWDTNWDVSSDGKRFVFVREPVVRGPQRLTVMTQWVGRAR